MNALMTDDELRALRAAVDHREGRGRTHWEGCHLDSSHRDCAIVRLLDEVERLTAWKAEMLAVLAPCDLQAVARLLGISLGRPIYEELQPAVERVLAERDRLREALSWAVGFIRCNFPKASARYADMRNAEALVDAAPLYSGEFHRASVRAELAEAERDQLIAEREAAITSVTGVDLREGHTRDNADPDQLRAMLYGAGLKIAKLAAELDTLSAESK